MDFTWPQELTDFRAELTEFIGKWRTPELLEESRSTHGGGGPLVRKFQAEINERGWSRMCWPEEYGGKNLNPLYQFIYVETME